MILLSFSRLQFVGFIRTFLVRTVAFTLTVMPVKGALANQTAKPTSDDAARKVELVHHIVDPKNLDESNVEGLAASLIYWGQNISPSSPYREGLRILAEANSTKTMEQETRKALTAFLKEPEDSSEKTKAMIATAVSYSYLNDLKSALKWATAAYKKDPSSLPAARLSLNLSVGIGDLEKAASISEELLKRSQYQYTEKSPLYARVLGAVGGTYMEGGYYAEAYQFLRRQCDIMQASKEAGWYDKGLSFKVLGDLYLSIGDTDSAKSLYGKAQGQIHNPPLDVEGFLAANILLGIATANLLQGEASQIDKAIAGATQTIDAVADSSDPRAKSYYARAQTILSGCLRSQGKFAESRDAAYKAVVTDGYPYADGSHPLHIQSSKYLLIFTQACALAKDTVTAEAALAQARTAAFRYQPKKPTVDASFAVQELLVHCILSEQTGAFDSAARELNSTAIRLSRTFETKTNAIKAFELLSILYRNRGKDAASKEALDHAKEIQTQITKHWRSLIPLPADFSKKPDTIH